MCSFGPDIQYTHHFNRLSVVKFDNIKKKTQNPLLFAKKIKFFQILTILSSYNENTFSAILWSCWPFSKQCQITLCKLIILASPES